MMLFAQRLAVASTKRSRTPPGCATIGSVFLMVFTIPEGRLRILPVKLNPAKTLPGES
jgi:hypothetical protein